MDRKTNTHNAKMIQVMKKRSIGRVYKGDHLDRIAFPLGGIGAGMICLDGNGAFSNVSLRHAPDVFNDPWIFGALCVKGKKNVARLLEGPVPSWKLLFPGGKVFGDSANGGGDKLFGLPRFKTAAFSSRFPFGMVQLEDPSLPVGVELTGWSPFVPGDSFSASLPVAGLEYAFVNKTNKAQEMVFSFHARNFIHIGQGESGVRCISNGFIAWQKATDEKLWASGECVVSTNSDNAALDNQWFRGGWFDAKTRLWKNISSGAIINNPTNNDGKGREGASIYVPLKLKAGERKTVRMRISWYVPDSDLRINYTRKNPEAPETPAYKPWYAGQFANVNDLTDYWNHNYNRLRNQTQEFTDCFYDSSLPFEVTESIAANLSILKSPTVMRQTDGRLWAWEGCNDSSGSCPGSCTHVWNYAQALPHLFPDLERSLRTTEFNENQDEQGHQNFRATLPIAPNDHSFHAAADGQLGGIMKVYRDWRISDDAMWLKSIWPRVLQSLDYCIKTWDPSGKGILEEPHHNTYDIEFWGPDSMCNSMYLGALKAAQRMGEFLGNDISKYENLFNKGKILLERDLYNGAYFEQKVVWKGFTCR